MKQIDKNFFPGWVRKSITFTIDDGNIEMDKKFIDITVPAGIKGTFNLNTPLKKLTPDEYRAFYKGYEIANHCKYHPFPFTEKTAAEIKNEKFDPETADEQYGYLTEEDGLFKIYQYKTWFYLATDEKYLDCVKDCERELEDVFGKGRIRGYVWPFYEPKNPRVVEMLKEYGFQSIRKTGSVKDTTAYALPANRTSWSYNYNPCTDGLCEPAKNYAEYPDDGNLKFFCFGLHSKDYERYDKWDELKAFCDLYGNRPEDFWYASVGEIFDYEDAVNALEITDTEVYNPSDLDLFIKIDGKRITLRAKSKIEF